MNTHNVNVKTAAQEPSERWGEGQEIKGISPALTESLAFLELLREQRMTLDERTELLHGALINMADQVCDTVTDWSCVRPLVPMASVRAWVIACRFVHTQFGETGAAAWSYAESHLSVQMKAGYAMYVADIA